MKHMTRGILLLFVLSTLPVIYGEAPPKGVAGVSVVVKQNPSKHTVTDARGNFSLEALPAGSYTLAFRPQNAKDTKAALTTKATVATSYSIKVEGTKRPITQSGLTSDKLLAGVEIRVEVGASAKVRGQVLAGGLKKMVWIPGETGSHMTGHWAEADSAEAKARRSDTQILSGEEMSDSMNRWNANMIDPKDPRNDPGLSHPGR
jgi:hypothetical protein